MVHRAALLPGTPAGEFCACAGGRKLADAARAPIMTARRDGMMKSPGRSFESEVERGCPACCSPDGQISGLRLPLRTIIGKAAARRLSPRRFQTRRGHSTLSRYIKHA